MRGLTCPTCKRPLDKHGDISLHVNGADVCSSCWSDKTGDVSVVRARRPGKGGR